MRCEACGYVISLDNKRFYCRKLGMHVFPRNNGYGPERSEDGSSCCWFTLEVTDEEPPFDLYP